MYYTYAFWLIDLALMLLHYFPSLFLAKLNCELSELRRSTISSSTVRSCILLLFSEITIVATGHECHVMRLDGLIVLVL